MRTLLCVGSTARRQLEKKAVAAGTPACLVTVLQSMKANHALGHSIDTYIKTFIYGWRLGQDMLYELHQHGVNASDQPRSRREKFPGSYAQKADNQATQEHAKSMYE